VFRAVLIKRGQRVVAGYARFEFASRQAELRGSAPQVSLISLTAATSAR
jgi:hypothetical protein